MDKHIAYIVTIAVCLLFQAGIAPAIAIGAAVPNFMLIAVLLIAMRSGFGAGSIAGFFCGLYVDFAGNTTIGCMALTLTLVGFFVGVGAAGVSSRSPLMACIIAVTSSLFMEIVYGIVIVLSNTETSGIIATMMSAALPSAFYTAVFACIALVTMNLVILDDTSTSLRLGGGYSASSRKHVSHLNSRLK